MKQHRIFQTITKFLLQIVHREMYVWFDLGQTFAKTISTRWQKLKGLNGFEYQGRIWALSYELGPGARLFSPEEGALWKK